MIFTASTGYMVVITTIRNAYSNAGPINTIDIIFMGAIFCGRRIFTF